MSTPTGPNASKPTPKVVAHRPAELAEQLNRLSKPSAKEQRQAAESIAEDLGVDVDLVIAAGQAEPLAPRNHPGE